MILAIFDPQVTPTCLLASLESVGLTVHVNKFKIDFQDGGHLALLIKMIFAIFDPQVALILPTKFQVTWPFGSGEVQNRFSRRWP